MPRRRSHRAAEARSSAPGQPSQQPAEDPALGSLNILSEIAASAQAHAADFAATAPAVTTSADGPSVLSDAALQAIFFPEGSRSEEDAHARVPDEDQAGREFHAALEMLHSGATAAQPLEPLAGSWTHSERLSVLRSADRKAEAALSANAEYAKTIKATLQQIGLAISRGEELESLANFYSGNADGGDGAGTAMHLAHGLSNVSLPMFKWKFDMEMPLHEHALIRERYNSVLQQQPWQSTERKKLADEVLHRARELAKERAGDENVVHDLSSSVNWDEIGSVTPGRTALECRIQWMQRQHPLINRARWTDAELDKLAKIASSRGEKDWQAIADELGTRRTPADCVRQFRGFTQSRKEWTPEEDQLLKDAVSIFGQNWQAVASHVGRTSNQCINRWSKTLKPDIKKGKWDKAEDDALRAAVAAVGPVWKLVAPRVKGRTDAQCRERWCNILDPRIFTGEWSAEEDEQLLALRGEGKTWSDISKAFGGRRTDNHIMRRHGELTKSAAKHKRKRKVDADDDADHTSPALEGAENHASTPSRVPKSRRVAAAPPAEPVSTRPRRQAARTRREAYVEDDDEDDD